jgi:thioredoxin reductase (NADPH)
MDSPELFLFYAAPLVLGVAIYLFFRTRASRRAAAVYAEAKEAGLTEPASLHPHIDLALCCGAAACVSACPEGDVIGVINGKARLIDPTACIGHGACAAACPTNAITLVFGTKTRGVELPVVSPDFQTNMPGLFVAGELGGMGLIRNAVSQGQQAMEAIERLRGRAKDRSLDLVIVGAGPAGLSASLAAKAAGMRFLTLEQEKVGGTIAHFPRGKVVMTKPANLPIVGPMKFSEITKEAFLDFWNDVIRKADLPIEYDAKLEALEQLADGFTITTSAGSYSARSVLLAIGRRGTPRKLDVAGEDLSKVVYRLDDPAQFKGQRVLVVGGGDSALEAAATIAEETNAIVDLSYRGDAFQRARRRNRERIDALLADRRMTTHLQSQVLSITHHHATLETANGELELENDAVIVCAGGILPTHLLKAMGVSVVTKYGEA